MTICQREQAFEIVQQTTKILSISDRIGVGYNQNNVPFWDCSTKRLMAFFDKQWAKALTAK